MERQGNQRYQRIVLVPFPFQGHMTPMFQLGTILYARGFSITIAHTNYNAPDTSLHPDFDFHSLCENLSPNDATTNNGVFSFIKSINSNCKPPLLQLLAKMMEREQAYGQVVGIIYDTIAYFAEAVADHIKIPSMVFRSSCPSYVLATHAMPRLRAEGYFPLQDSMLHELVPELYPLRFKDLPFSKETMEDSLELFEITSKLRSSSAIIWITINCLEPESLSQLQQHYQVPFFTVGPLHKLARVSSTSLIVEDISCLAWLDKQAPNSVIYVSLGSLVSIDAKELAEMAWGLANSDQPFLWVVRPGSVLGSEWIELLPEGFMEKIGEKGDIVKWAPQKDVLAHNAVGGFWSHCGWNSTIESICEGVPIICRPYFVDQKVIARCLSYVWGVGLELEVELDRGDIERAIRRVLVEKEGLEMRKRVIEMKANIEICICEGGSSYSSMNDLAKFFLSF